jgi:hypothetical protein
VVPGSAAAPVVSRRPYLVFVRAGDQSWHRTLLAENPDRNWDCCVSWYVRAHTEQGAEYYLGDGQAFNKLEGFLEFWEQAPKPWPYRYVLLLDDDIYLRPGDLSRFFELCDRHGTFLSQPALRWFTHTTLNFLVRNPVCLLRRVSFVEVMAPCFCAAALEQLLYTFRWTKSTWGIDWAWGALLESREPIYVVDDVAVYHTRTGDGRPPPFYLKLKAMGIDAGEELARIRQMYPIFRGRRRLREGHVYRAGVPRSLGLPLMLLFEHLKFVVRLRKQLWRTWRVWRARLEDLWRGKRE